MSGIQLYIFQILKHWYFQKSTDENKEENKKKGRKKADTVHWDKTVKSERLKQNTAKNMFLLK